MFLLAPIRRILPLTVTVVLSCSLAAAQQAPPPLLQQDTKPAKKCKPKDAACNSVQNSSSSDSSSSSSSQPKSLHDEFPFPTDDSKHGGDAEGAVPAPTTPAANPNGLPAMPTTPVPDPPAESEKPMNLPRDSSGSLPPGTSSSSSSDDDDVAPTTESPNAPVKAAPLKNYGAKDSDEVIREKLDKTRLPDDLKVGRFYLDSGNNQGAYLRFKDAVSLDAEDPDARFYLAEAASKLNHRDEAIANYQECLKLDPGGDHDKAARRALAKFGITAQK